MVQIVRFVWHYVQMSIARYLGMLLPVGLLSALGLASVVSRSPEASALVMTAEMALGMVAWMTIRRHPWRHTVEMSAGMSASTVVAAAASLAGLLPHTAVQIAARLFISERTVTTHVTNMLNKLGLSSRIQLASWVAGAGEP